MPKHTAKEEKMLGAPRNWKRSNNSKRKLQQAKNLQQKKEQMNKLLKTY